MHCGSSFNLTESSQQQTDSPTPFPKHHPLARHHPYVSDGDPRLEQHNQRGSRAILMVVATCDTSMQTAHHQAEVKAGRGWRPAEPGTRRVGAGLHRGPGAATGVRSLPYQQSNALAIEMEGKEWGIVRKKQNKP